MSQRVPLRATETASNAELDALAERVDASQGEAMIDAVYAFLGRFVAYPSEYAHVAHSLWCVHTHLMDSWDSTPRLAFLSPEPASGKSRALEATELLVPNPVLAVNVSPAYLFRKVGCEEGVAILFDEIDTVFGPKAKDNEEIRGLLNAGHRRGATAGRCVVKGKAIETEEIPAYAAVALAGLGWLPDTIMSRAVVIRMRRRHAGEQVEGFRRRHAKAEGFEVRTKIETWARSKRGEIEWPTMPAEIQDRDADVWEPLIAVADAVDGSWPARARAAAVALIAESKEGESSLGIQLLADLRTVFGSADQMTSRDIIRGLVDLEEAPWGDFKGKPLDERGLASRLRAYGVKSKTIRVGTATPKGYRREDLHDVWLRYLPLSPAKSTTTATSETGPADIARNVAPVAPVVDLPGYGGGLGHKCVQCRQNGETVEVHYGDAPVRLHREWVERWKAEFDEQMPDEGRRGSGVRYA